MEVTTQEKNIRVSQHNIITEARYEMTALQKNIVYYLLRIFSPNNKNQQYYEVKAHDLYDFMEGEVVDYKKLREATKGLLKFYYEGFVPNEETGNADFLQINLFSSIRYITGRGIIKFGIDNEIKPYLFDLKTNFTEFELKTALQFKSVYSKRIYEGLNQFKNSDNQEWYISIEELKKRLCVETKYTRWIHFKQRVLDVAHKEINDYKEGDIKFELELIKTSRKITHLCFHINYTKKTIKQMGDDFFYPWQKDRIDELLTGKELKTLEYWLKLAINDYNAKGVKNLPVFVTEFCEYFCRTHYKKELEIYKGKRNFSIDFDIYKPKN